MVEYTVDMGSKEVRNAFADISLRLSPNKENLRKARFILSFCPLVFAVMLISELLKTNTVNLVYVIAFFVFLYFPFGIRQLRKRQLLKSMNKAYPDYEVRFRADPSGIHSESPESTSDFKWNVFNHYDDLGDYFYLSGIGLKVVLCDKRKLSPKELEEFRTLAKKHIKVK